MGQTSGGSVRAQRYPHTLQRQTLISPSAAGCRLSDVAIASRFAGRLSGIDSTVAFPSRTRLET
jgi:hypothetical protein